RGTLVGPIVGAFAVNGAKSWFTVAFPQFWLYFLGLLFVLATLFLPRGLAGLWLAWRERKGVGVRLRLTPTYDDRGAGRLAVSEANSNRTAEERRLPVSEANRNTTAEERRSPVSEANRDTTARDALPAGDAPAVQQAPAR